MLTDKPPIMEAPEMMNKIAFCRSVNSARRKYETNLSSIRPSSWIVLHECMFNVKLSKTLGMCGRDGGRARGYSPGGR